MLITLFTIILYSFNSIDYFTTFSSTTSTSTTPPPPIIIENDIAITTLVDDLGIKKAQHASIYTLSTGKYYIYIHLLKRNVNGNTIIVLDESFNIVDEFCKVPGTCIQVVNDYLYVGVPNNIYRYDIDSSTGLVSDTENPILILRGVQSSVVADSPIFVVNKDTNALCVHISSPTNSCQLIHMDRKKGVKGEMPCNRLKFNSSVWIFDANKPNQTISMGILYSTGIRRMRSLVLYNNELYGIIQGRDSLYELYPKYYSKKQGEELAPDELVYIEQNSNFGFPYCYWDPSISKRVLSPEYGGDGKNVANCNSLTEKPIEVFTNHNGPNDLLIDDNKLFIAWNGKPYPMKCDVSCSKLTVSFFELNPDYEELKINGKQNVLVQFNKTHKTKPSGLVKLPDKSILIIDSISGKLWKSVLKSL